MALTNGLFISKVAHARQRPKKNSFWYGVYYLAFPLDEMARLAECALLSVNRGNLFSFHEKDHDTGGLPVDAWARKILAEWEVPQADGRIVLVTLPRLFGYVFNPVSFFFCLDKAGALRAVISEVHNTFGDKHSYICFHDDRRPVTQDDFMQADKQLHVSPFIKVDGHYVFRFAYGEEKLGVWIDHHDADGLLLTTSIIGKREPLTTGNMLKAFFRYPLVTFKVMTLIHYQALRLWMKGVKYIKRPPAPQTEVSR
ncbi:MAG: DUF1365 domain-containing protein [bacterium]|nr:DUF1365 domain-containing protein [bacterium]